MKCNVTDEDKKLFKEGYMPLKRGMYPESPAMTMDSKQRTWFNYRLDNRVSVKENSYDQQLISAYQAINRLIDKQSWVKRSTAKKTLPMMPEEKIDISKWKLR